jgi:hypothetical protein
MEGANMIMIRALSLAMVVGGLALIALPAAAEDDPPVAALERQVAELERELAALKGAGAMPAERLVEIERRIEILTREIEDLKLGEAVPEAEASAHGLGPAASKVYAVRRGVSVGGYGEIIYDGFDATNESGAASGLTDQVDVQRLVLYFGYKFDDRVVFNSEIEYEHATTGEGAEDKGEVSVEFAYLDFLLTDAVNVRTGLVLVPMGFINELHEPPIFLGSRRPEVEQRLIPTTWREIGVGLFGEAGPLAYRAYVTSSLASVEGSTSGAEGFDASGIRNGRASGSRVAAEDFAFTGRIDWKPGPGWQLGAALFAGDTGQDQSFDGRTLVLDLHAEVRWRGLQARALWVETRIDDVDRINQAQGFTGNQSVGEAQFGAYAEVGFDVLSLAAGSRQALIPFLRYERLDTQETVPEGFAPNPARDRSVTTFGLHWQPIPNVALKLDYNRNENEARTGVDRINAALGFLF